MDDYPVQMRVETENGERLLEKIYFTELGHIMAKVYDVESKIWSRINLGPIESILESKGISVTEYTTYKPSAFRKLTD